MTGPISQPINQPINEPTFVPTAESADNPLAESADNPLADLRARAAAPDATAGDCLALGQLLLQHAARDKDRQREALAALVRAYQLDPACEPTLLHTIAQTAFVLRDWSLTEAAAQLLLSHHAADANALIWRAAAVQQRDDFALAEHLLREAMRAVPGNPVVLHKLALCVKEQARFVEAEALLRQVLVLSPDNAHALFDLSELEIRTGRFADGWAHYESRVAFGGELNNAQQALASISAHWQGESLAGKTLVVYGEQGNGDCLWAVRFLPHLAERARREGGRVIFGHDGPLRYLFERILPADLPLETSLDTRPDFHCGLMSLPLRLGVVDATGWGRPYLNADPTHVQAWRERVDAHVAHVAGKYGRRKVGLVWNGNPDHIRDARRSVPVEQLEALLNVPGASYFALSPGRGETVAQWRKQGLDVVDMTGHFQSGFDDVAALLANLDLVVTIDSGPAHLAGALGVPTCLMIDHVSAWFWGDESSATPWYDSIELVRQPRVGDWMPVVAHVRERIVALVRN
ncbi:glycosyltransferase family 9 protein [Paraburkholderia bryophila]|uniref:Glycosyl transferase family 9 (Putative heptosyltransferase) n=1 Tax=Paraburkholderia bryophila TaxID=420952 RepID=A0A329BDB0_9BURK|nr:glycosyltransferase family 9 protein [Paraburkholderia bryophila]RAS19520.1 glycosyl transferase family 9 (putative heptosyltransferase) [Paraburkholderia bryophila]